MYLIVCVHVCMDVCVCVYVFVCGDRETTKFSTNSTNQLHVSFVNFDNGNMYFFINLKHIPLQLSLAIVSHRNLTITRS